MTNSIAATIQLLAPLSHGEFGPSTGNTMRLRRLPLVVEGGEVIRVPVVSGNALRNRMRRIVFHDLLERADMLYGHDRLYAAVANGGTLSGAGESTIDPDAIRHLRETLPPLSVFGSALYTWLFAGRCSVGFCWPVCDVTVDAGLTTSDAVPPSMADIEIEVAHTRLPDREYQDFAVSGVGPMPYTLEALAPGVQLQSTVTFLAVATEIEQSVIAWALDRINSLGGRSAAGIGICHVEHDGDAKAYQEWLNGDLAEVKEALAGLC